MCWWTFPYWSILSSTGARPGWPTISRNSAMACSYKQKPQKGDGGVKLFEACEICECDGLVNNDGGMNMGKNMEKHGKTTKMVNKVTKFKNQKKRILRNLNPDPKCYNPPTPDRTLSLAIHSPTVLSGFSAQITNQDQTLFSFYPGGCDCSHNIAQTSAGKRRADPAFSKRSSVSTSICILGME